MINSDSARKILYLLRNSENGLTIEELCESLNVTPMAVHRPLTLLTDQGLVTFEQLRSSEKGRPARIYKISEAADELFPKNYGYFAVQLLEQLRDNEGISRIRRLFEGTFRKSAEKIRGLMKGKDLPSRVRIMSQVLNENNYMAEQKQLSNGKFMIKMLNCPISKVAKEFPQACSCEQHFLSEVLQAKVRRDHHILNGQNYCSYIIQRK
jgi:predicted ArsR family transcriptional regulator